MLTLNSSGSKLWLFSRRCSQVDPLRAVASSFSTAANHRTLLLSTRERDAAIHAIPTFVRTQSTLVDDLPVFDPSISSRAQRTLGLDSDDGSSRTPADSKPRGSRKIKMRKAKDFRPKSKTVYDATTTSGKSPTANESRALKDADGEPAEQPDYGTESVSESPDQTRALPPHIRLPIDYTRRVEGLLQPLDQPTLVDVVPDSGQRPVATLEHGLDRVLFNPGVHWLQDPRSQVYNFTTYLESIPRVKDFAFDRLTGFTPSSRDEDLWALAKRENRKFSGSTSSLTKMLSHIYFLISGNKRVNVDTLSSHFQKEPTNFTPGQRMPASIVMKYKDGVYAIDSHSDIPIETDVNVLTWLGTLLEKFLTSSPGEFVALMRATTVPKDEEMDPRREAYRYAKSTKVVMRSQLDCHDPRLPGTGVFDIKTRAAVPIRLDLLNYVENAGYLIKTLHGPIESFEKEYFDLIRAGFLKYVFQARIGNMDGVLVAYHNTARMFGFQYIPVEEMDERLFGGSGKRGEQVFEKCVGMLEVAVEEASLCFPEQSVICTFETLESSGVMNVWVEPAEWDEQQGPKPMHQLDIQASNYIGSEEVRPSRAISMAGQDESWTIHWSVSRSSLSHSEVIQNYRMAKDRQFRAYNLPAGVSIKNINQFLRTKLNFAGGIGEDTSIDRAYFQMASKNIKYLRGLARAGTEELKEKGIENRGKMQIVWEGGVQDVIRADPSRAEVSAEADASAADASELELAVVDPQDVDVDEEVVDPGLQAIDALPTSQDTSEVEIAIALETEKGKAEFVVDGFMMPEGTLEPEVSVAEDANPEGTEWSWVKLEEESDVTPEAPTLSTPSSEGASVDLGALSAQGRPEENNGTPRPAS